MENLIEITPNCYIVRTQAGFSKLCKKLHCKKESGTNGNGEYCYAYKISQITDKKEAFIEEEYTSTDNQLAYTYKKSVQYPIMYPCILTFQDETFETDTYYFYIKYVFDDLKIRDFKDASELCKDYDKWQ